METDEIANAILPDLKGFAQGLPCHKRRGISGLLVEMFPVGGDCWWQAFCPVAEFRRKVGRRGRKEPATGKIIQIDSGEVVAGAINEAVGVRLLERERIPEFFGYVYFADHDMMRNISRRMGLRPFFLGVLAIELKRLDSFGDHQYSRDHE